MSRSARASHRAASGRCRHLKEQKSLCGQPVVVMAAGGVGLTFVRKENESGDEQESVQQEEAQEPAEKPVKEPSAKEKAATKIVKKIDDKARYDESNQMKTLIVMQILGNTKTFFDTQSTIVDTDVNEYLNKTIEDNYGVLFDMAQAQTMEDMINAQY